MLPTLLLSDSLLRVNDIQQAHWGTLHNLFGFADHCHW